MQPLLVVPAIHVHQGVAVLVHRGAGASEESLGDPLEWARRYAADGAEWIQLVDLDAARGRGGNAELCTRLAREVAGTTRILFCGGARDEATLAAELEAGMDRIIIGTSLHDTPTWCRSAIERFGDRIVVGLDVLEGSVPAYGWARQTGSVPEAVEHLVEVGCSRVVVRCLASDGKLTGPNYELLGQICARTDAGVIASGGIASVEDLRRLRGLVPIGVEGAVVGTALSRGTFGLRDALQVATGERPVTPPIDPRDER